MRRTAFHILVGIVLLSALSCGRRPDETAAAVPESPGEKKYPARIVSMAPSITEVVFALGLGDRVVGVTDFCDYPPEALAKTKVGGVVNPNMEAVVALEPDLVLALPNVTHESLFRSLRNLGVRVLTLSNDSTEDLFATIQAIGVETSTRREAEEMIGRLRAKFAAIRGKVSKEPRRRVMFIVGVDPLFVAGTGTFIDELITMAGGTNIAGDISPDERRVGFSKYPQLGIEEVLAREPEVILYTSLNFELTPEQEEAARELWKAYPSIPAVRDGRIHGLVADHVTLAGPRLVIGIEEMARAIHPHAFEQEEHIS